MTLDREKKIAEIRKSAEEARKTDRSWVDGQDYADDVEFLLDELERERAELDRLKRGGWIRLKDQNPRNGQNVWICYEIDGRRDTAESRYVNGSFIGFWGANVTHWQPLPEPPKE